MHIHFFLQKSPHTQKQIRFRSNKTWIYFQVSGNLFLFVLGVFCFVLFFNALMCGTGLWILPGLWNSPAITGFHLTPSEKRRSCQRLTKLCYLSSTYSYLLPLPFDFFLLCPHPGPLCFYTLTAQAGARPASRPPPLPCSISGLLSLFI